MNTNFTTQNDLKATEIADANALVDLFAEELPEQHDNRIPGLCCVSTLSSVGGCWATLSSLSSTC